MRTQTELARYQPPEPTRHRPTPTCRLRTASRQQGSRQVPPKELSCQLAVRTRPLTPAGRSARCPASVATEGAPSDDEMLCPNQRRWDPLACARVDALAPAL